MSPNLIQDGVEKTSLSIDCARQLSVIYESFDHKEIEELKGDRSKRISICDYRSAWMYEVYVNKKKKCGKRHGLIDDWYKQTDVYIYIYI